MRETIAHYQVISALYESELSLIYRVESMASAGDLPAVGILKLPRSEYPSNGEIERVLKEFEFINLFDSDWVIRAFKLGSHNNRPFIFLEDFNAVSVRDYLLQKGTPPLDDFFLIALSVTQALAEVHHKNLIHKDINPNNILINHGQQQVKLIDFGLATKLSREYPTLKNPAHLEGTLAYLSPEQTGRMNRSLDYRTDFYSLGITFYELLAGSLPFDSHDKLELVHAHLAKEAIPLHQINPAIPVCLSRLVMKLMAKQAEDRYQSAWGIRHDLETIRQHLDDSEFLDHFVIARHDVSDKFQIYQKLYGREQQLGLLAATFEQVAEGDSQVLLIAGYSGIGKSSLVQEVYKQVSEKKGYFIAGKFDQLQRNTPYSALLQAMESLLRQILTENEPVLKSWQYKLQQALGDNGQLMVEVLPVLELIIGTQTPPTQLAPQEAQNRFNFTFQNLIRACCEKGHPLTLFIDDLQWIDAATLNLLPLMMGAIPYLFVIGAYRDNEVDNTHPLVSVLKDLQARQINIKTITLAPLQLAHIEHLLSDSLHRTLAEVKPLAELVLEKSGGNPFFMGEFLKALYYEELLNFNGASQAWAWDVKRIHEKNITDNVVGLLANKIIRLPKDSQALLSLGAVLGNSFDVELLAICAEDDVAGVRRQLWYCLQEGLVIPLSEQRYKFVHDRVQQAAYSLIDGQGRPALHLKIGRLLKDKLPAKELAEQLFSVVDHLNLGAQLLGQDDGEEKQALALLNLEAGKQAKLANAYQVAYAYLQQAILLTPSQRWEDNYATTLELYSHAAEAAYLCRQDAALAAWGQAVIAHAQSALDTFSLYVTRIRLYHENGQLEQGVVASLEILEHLGVPLPLQPTQEEIAANLAEAEALLTDTGIDALLALPEMDDKQMRAAITLLVDMAPSTYSTNPMLFCILIATGMKLSIQYGNAPSSSYIYAVYSMLLGSQNRPEQSYQLGQVALNLAERFRAPYVHSRTYLTVALIAIPAKLHVRETLPLLETAKRLAFAEGDGQYFAYLSYVKVYYTSLIENSLPALWGMLCDIDALLKKHNNKINVAWNSIYIWHCAQLLKKDVLAEGFLGYDVLRQILQDSNNLTGLCLLYYRRAVGHYLLEPEGILESLQLIQQAEQLASSIMGLLDGIYLVFHGSLIRLAAIGGVPPEEGEAFLRQVKNNLAVLAIWADSAPMNFQYQCDLLAAEIARIEQDYWLAGTLYQKALQGAKRHGHLRDEALTGELAGRFYWQQGLELVAQTYLVEAHYAYQRWGALAKTLQLEQSYPFLRAKRAFAGVLQATPNKITTHNSVANQQADPLDVLCIVKASQTLAGEMQLERLLQQLLQILLASAGASRGAILLPETGQWLVQADSHHPEQTELLNAPLGDYRRLPSTLIHYVARTKKILLLDKLMGSQFNNDPYFQDDPPLSALCLPLMQHEKINGIIYLENNLTENAFTPERIALLEMLSGQILISIENALLYRNLETRVNERTQKLSDTLEELKTTQTHLVESEKMAALGTLVAGVAHEINNPANFAHLGMHNLKESLGKQKQFLLPLLEDEPAILSILGQQYQQLDSSLENIEEGCVRIKAIVDDLRTFSRLDEAERKVVDLMESLKATIRITQTQYQKRVQILTDFQAQPKLECWPAKLNQVFMNIIVNACHAIEKKQETNPGIRGGLIIASFEKEQDGHKELVIRFRDNGCGMSEAVKNKIFEPFFTTKPIGQGTGLGMSLSYGIIQEHNGRIEVESHLGQGTTVTLCLPLL